MKYRLDVVASGVVDVVRFAGGWLFARAMAGWDGTVLLTDVSGRTDARPLQILGPGCSTSTRPWHRWEFARSRRR